MACDAPIFAGEGQHAATDGSTKKNDGDDSELAETLRTASTNFLQNLGLVAAFMCALAANIYVNPPLTPLCYGEEAVQIMVWIEWFAMGFFFLAICTVIVLSLDIDGIPDYLLSVHLSNTRKARTVPLLCTVIGLLLTAVGYGIDIDMRSGCPWGGAGLGVILAPCFPLLVVGYSLHLRRQRIALNVMDASKRYGNRLGASWVSTWVDRMPQEKADESFMKAKGLRRASRSSGTNDSVANAVSGEVSATQPVIT